MRSILLVVSILSFVWYRSAQSDTMWQGTWSGHYGPTWKKIDIKLVIRPGNEVDFYSHEEGKTGIATGTYVAKRNEVAITCRWVNGDTIPITIKGYLLPQVDMANVTQVTDATQKDNFYLRKITTE